MIDFGYSSQRMSEWAKIKSLPIPLLALIIGITTIGTAALYSAADGDFGRWAQMHVLRFSVLFVMMIVISIINLKYWYWLAYPLWGIGMILLLGVEIMGHIGMGAQRWINLGFINLQPSELMKIAVIMALARYYHDLDQIQIRQYRKLVWPSMLMAIPMALVMAQPDLGTALMIGMGGIAVMFLAGVRMRLFILGIVALAAIIPLAYHYGLQDYQRKRVDTFLDPSQDPTGSGYHITQSKIAIGSGGWNGKGFMDGTQARLNFLPEKHTDFIFTLWSEEFGFWGDIGLLSLYVATFIIGFIFALQARHVFARLLILGLTMNLSLYVVINTGMVMGLMPVVGVPLPLISYGGSAMLAALICYGLIISARIHKGQPLPKGHAI